MSRTPETIGGQLRPILLMSPLCFWGQLFALGVSMATTTTRATDLPLGDASVVRFADVRQGKYFELDLATTERAQAERLAADVADKVLANPVIESYRIEVD